MSMHATVDLLHTCLINNVTQAEHVFTESTVASHTGILTGIQDTDQLEAIVRTPWPSVVAHIPDAGSGASAASNSGRICVLLDIPTTVASVMAHELSSAGEPAAVTALLRRWFSPVIVYEHGGMTCKHSWESGRQEPIDPAVMSVAVNLATAPGDMKRNARFVSPWAVASKELGRERELIGSLLERTEAELLAIASSRPCCAVMTILPLALPLTSQHADTPVRLLWELPMADAAGVAIDFVAQIVSPPLEVVKRSATAVRRAAELAEMPVSQRIRPHDDKELLALWTSTMRESHASLHALLDARVQHGHSTTVSARLPVAPWASAPAVPQVSLEAPPLLAHISSATTSSEVNAAAPTPAPEAVPQPPVGSKRGRSESDYHAPPTMASGVPYGSVDVVALPPGVPPSAYSPNILNHQGLLAQNPVMIPSRSSAMQVGDFTSSPMMSASLMAVANMASAGEPGRGFTPGLSGHAAGREVSALQLGYDYMMGRSRSNLSAGLGGGGAFDERATSLNSL